MLSLHVLYRHIVTHLGNVCYTGIQEYRNGYSDKASMRT